MTTAPYILARTFAEAHAFATDDLGLGKGHYRVVNSSGTLKAVRGVTLYLVPGWRQRFDRFAMQSALRWTRMDVFDVAEERAKAPAATCGHFDAANDSSHDCSTWGDEPAGDELTPVGDDEAHAFVVTLGKIGTPGMNPSGPLPFAPPIPPEQAQEPAPRRRRRRCDDCGILVDPDDVEQHAAEHLAEGV